QNAAGSRLDPPDFGRLRDDRHRSGRRTLAQRAKSGDLEVKRQATWGMSDQKALEETQPEVARLFRNVSLDTDTLSQMTFALVIEKQDPAEFAKNWTATHADRVLGWLSD
ncbi:hypothetical protein G5V65_21695, partial [Rhodobacter sp. HX-7-19]